MGKLKTFKNKGGTFYLNPSEVVSCAPVYVWSSYRNSSDYYDVVVSFKDGAQMTILSQEDSHYVNKYVEEFIKWMENC